MYQEPLENIIPSSVEINDFIQEEPKPIPDGGTKKAINENSIIEILKRSSKKRLWYIRNTGPSILHLFHKNSFTKINILFTLLPNAVKRSDILTGHLPLYAWSEGAEGELSFGYYSE